MIKRTTVELDSDLVEHAKAALHIATTRGVIEEALRRAASSADQAHDERRAAQMQFLRTLEANVDLDVLASDQMWR
jgi:Arc/MetJ family transcription regulator